MPLSFKSVWFKTKLDAFELWCWRRLLTVSWTASRPNQSILKEISPGCSLEGLMLKLKLQFFVRLMRRADSLEKTLMLGGIEGRRMPGASMRNSAHGKGHEKGGSAYAKAESSLRRPPVTEHLPPKPESARFTVLCFPPTLLTLTGGCPPTTFFWKKLI